LRNRRITALHEASALRFHPRCYYRSDADAPTVAWPALIAGVTDLDGKIIGVHRTWLNPSGDDKAPVGTPRRAMGQPAWPRGPVRRRGRNNGCRRRN
jgi:hypothetical protein